MVSVSVEDALLIGLGAVVLFGDRACCHDDDGSGNGTGMLSVGRKLASFLQLRDMSSGGGCPRVIAQKEYEVLTRGYGLSDLPVRGDPKSYEAGLDKMLRESIPQCVKGMSAGAFVPKESPMIMTSGKKLMNYKLMNYRRSPMNLREPDDSV